MAPKPITETISPDKNKSIYIPYFDKEKSSNCLDCEEKPCIEACDMNIIYLDEETKLPLIKFGNELDDGYCTFCEDCKNACKLEVLTKSDGKINTNLKIKKSCFAYNSTMCYVCKEACMVDAIEFVGLFFPDIDSTKCNGCNLCLIKCPSASIERTTISKE